MLFTCIITREKRYLLVVGKSRENVRWLIPFKLRTRLQVTPLSDQNVLYFK